MCKVFALKKSVAIPCSLLHCLSCDRSVRQCRRKRKWLPLALFTASRQLYSGYKVDLQRGVSKRTVRGRLVTVGNPQLVAVQLTQLRRHSSCVLFTFNILKTNTYSVKLNASVHACFSGVSFRHTLISRELFDTLKCLPNYTASTQSTTTAI